MAQEIGASRSNLTYLTPSYLTGRLISKSKTELPGFKPYYSKANPEEIKGYYKEYWATDKAHILDISLKPKTETFKQNQLLIRVGNDLLQLNLEDNYKNIDSFAASVVKVLPNMDYSQEYVLRCGTKTEIKKDGKERLKNKTVYFNYGEKDSLKWAVDLEDIPNWVKNTKTDPVTKEEVVTWDKSGDNDFHYDLMHKEIARFAEYKKTKTYQDILAIYEGEAQHSEPEAKDTSPVVAQGSNSNKTQEDNDDLPF